MSTGGDYWSLSNEQREALDRSVMFHRLGPWGEYDLRKALEKSHTNSEYGASDGFLYKMVGGDPEKKSEDDDY